MNTPKLHVEHNVKLESITAILRTVDNGPISDNDIALDRLSKRLWPTLNEGQCRNYLRKNLNRLFKLGLLHYHDQETNIFSLTRIGNCLKYVLSYDIDMFVEILHHLQYYLFSKEPTTENAFSWTYRTICDVLWEWRPQKINNKSVVEVVYQKAQNVFKNSQNTSLSHYAIQGVRNWVCELSPSFLTKKKGRFWSNNGRTFCAPEALILSLKNLIIERGLRFGEPVLLTDNTINAICKATLLSPAAFDDVLDVARNLSVGLSFDSSQWGRSVYLEKKPNLESIVGC